MQKEAQERQKGDQKIERESRARVLDFGEVPEQTGDRDNDVGQQKRREFQDLGGYADSTRNTVRAKKNNSACKLEDRAGDIAGKLGADPDARRRARGKNKSERRHNPPPGH